jgi:hypothetical protein
VFAKCKNGRKALEPEETHFEGERDVPPDCSAPGSFLTFVVLAECRNGTPGSRKLGRRHVSKLKRGDSPGPFRAWIVSYLYCVVLECRNGRKALDQEAVMAFVLEGKELTLFTGLG